MLRIAAKWDNIKSVCVCGGGGIFLVWVGGWLSLDSPRRQKLFFARRDTLGEGGVGEKTKKIKRKCSSCRGVCG